MKAFVTGGTGFVGSHLVEHLLDLAEFEEVRVLIRNKEKWLKGLDYTPVKSTLENLKPIKMRCMVWMCLFMEQLFTRSLVFRFFYSQC